MFRDYGGTISLLIRPGGTGASRNLVCYQRRGRLWMIYMLRVQADFEYIASQLKQ